MAQEISYQKLLYIDLNPGDVNLGHPKTNDSQQIIKNLREGEFLCLHVNEWNNGWIIKTREEKIIGSLSKRGNIMLNQQGIIPNQFEFQQGEVTVKNVYRHIKRDELTNVIIEDRFVVIPQIRVCRES
jgi:ATP-dependent DNA helicase RecQ